MDLITINLDDYQPHPKNPNGHPDKQLSELGESLDQFGQFKNVVCWRGYYLAGHGLVEAARRKGLTTLQAVDMSHLPEDKALALMVADNRLPELAVMDNDSLTEILKIFDEPLDIPGIDDDFLRSLGIGQDNGKEPDAPPVDKAAELQEKWGTQLGQVWQLGEHRLAVGDCTDKAVVEAVMRGERAYIQIQDPPYGINLGTNYSYLNGIQSSTKYKYPKGVGGNYQPIVDDDNIINFTKFNVLETKEAFWWGANYYHHQLPNGGSWLVWDKQTNDNGGEVIDKIGSSFELCWSMIPHRQVIIRKLWRGYFGIETQDTKARMHPTQKPVEVIAHIVKQYSRDGDICADFFLGSGTTLIACEQLSRKCRGIEIDPGNAAVTLQRWADLTGREPVLLSDQ